MALPGVILGKRQRKGGNSMKRIMIALTPILVIGLVASGSATAELISNRLHQQKARIHQGVDSGALTGSELHRLMQQHRKIRRIHQYAWQDGYLSHHERRHLQDRLDRASRRIHRLKHNEEWAQARYRFDHRARHQDKGRLHR